MVPLPQIASIEPKDVYGQRVLQLGTPEESVPGQNKVYLPRRLCSSALRLVLTLDFGNLSQALYHAGSCLESAFVTPWNYFSYLRQRRESSLIFHPTMIHVNRRGQFPTRVFNLFTSQQPLLLLSPGLISRTRVPPIPRVSTLTRVPQSLRRGYEKLECLRHKHYLPGRRLCN